MRSHTTTRSTITRLLVGLALIAGILVAPPVARPGDVAYAGTSGESSATRATITDITGGYRYTCALLSTGDITCWGGDFYGELGNGATTGDITTPPDPITLPTGTTAIAITAGDAHACAVLNTGDVTCWGWDWYGQLGNGATTGNIDAPPAAVTLPTGTTATNIAAGDSHTCALLNTGDITCWGSDSNGQLGNGATTGNIDAPPAAVTLPTGTTATAITAGAAHTCALLNTGDITCWGDDFHGQLGNGATTDDIDSPPAAVTLPTGTTATGVAAGGVHTCALLDTGDVTCWGRAADGQLGNGATASDIDTPPAAVTLPTGTTAVAIAAGFTHTCAVLNTGDMTCWGYGFNGQLGNGTTLDVTTPPTPIALPNGTTATAIGTGAHHTCAVLNTGEMTCWGYGFNGQLGNGTTLDVTTPPTPVDLPETPAHLASIAVDAGAAYVCALLNTGDITCWGHDDSGQLGNGATTGNIDAPPTPITLPAGSTAAATTAGFYHACALLNTGDITCWGRDADGQLGNGTTTGNITTPPTPITLPASTTATAITAGAFHTCALLNTGEITCWGDDSSGQLGNGTTTGSITAPPDPITLPSGTTATAITSGALHTCAILNTGDVTCWGDDRSGQLGNGAATSDIAAPPTPITLPTGTTATHITAGGYHTCAILNTGDTTCWGRDDNGQLGNGATTGNIDAPPTPITLPTGTTATHITAGAFHTCATLNTGDVTCWGWDADGQLGNGAASDDIAAPPDPITLPAGTTAATIAAGAYHTCAILNTGDTTCWGWDTFGQLGNGATAGGQTAPDTVEFQSTPTFALASGQTTPTNDATIDIELTFTNSVSILNATDIDLAGTANANTVAVSGSGTGWTVEISGMTKDGTVTVDIDDGDLGHYGNLASNTLTIDWDATEPIADIDLADDQSATTTNTPVAFTVTFDEPVTDFTTDDIGIAGTAGATDGTISGSGTDYTVTIDSVPAPGTVTLAVTYRDTAGNPTTNLSTADTITVVDDIAPTLVVPADIDVDAAPGATTATATWTIADATDTGPGTNPIAPIVPTCTPTSGSTFPIGTSTVTCTATDTSGNTATDTFAVTVNATPEPAPPIAQLTPQRFFETRPDEPSFDDQGRPGARLAADSTTRIDIAGRGDIEAAATAIIANIAAVNATGGGYLTIWNCSTPRPTASAINYAAGQTIANEVLVELSTNGDICVYTSAATDLILDIVATVDDPSINLDTPRRYFETRPDEPSFDDRGRPGQPLAADTTTRIQITDRGDIDPDTAAVIANIAAVNAHGPGFLTIWDCSLPRPTASNINYAAGQTIANEIIANLSTTGDICVYTSQTTDLIVDIVGAIETTSSITPSAPRRYFETRPDEPSFDNQGRPGRPLAADTTTQIRVHGRGDIDTQTDAVIANVAAVNAQGAGYLTIWNCATPRPTASALNYIAGDTIANETLIEISNDGHICVYTSQRTDLIVDIIATIN